MRRAALVGGILTLALVAAPGLGAAVQQEGWSSWRGPLGTGVAPAGDPPLELGENQNVDWRIDLPGEGSGSPVIWGDVLYVTTAIQGEGDSYSFELWAVSRTDGSVIWRRTATEAAPHEGRQPTNTYASFSPIVDGTRVYAYFGSRGLFAYDLDGSPLWQVDLGDMRTRRGFGEGSSPALFGDHLVVIWDHEDDSFIVALDAATGEELWRNARDEPSTWATPLIVPVGDVVQVVTAGVNRMRGYDLATGELLWDGPGLTLNPIPTPVTDGTVAYLTAGFRGNSLRAVDLTKAAGNLDGSDALLWERDADTPYVPSPLLYDGNLYYLKSNTGVLTSVDAATGEVNFGPVRLPDMGTIYASPVGAAGRVYLFDRTGNAVVLRNGPEFEVLAMGQFNDGFDASPAIVGGEMYLRGHRSLYRLSAR